MRVNRSGVRWSSDALAALYPGTRTSISRAELARRYSSALTQEARRELAIGVLTGVLKVADQPPDGDQGRDVAAEEREALAAQAKRDDELVRRQRERE